MLRVLLKGLKYKRLMMLCFDVGFCCCRHSWFVVFMSTSLLLESLGRDIVPLEAY